MSTVVPDIPVSATTPGVALPSASMQSSRDVQGRTSVAEGRTPRATDTGAAMRVVAFIGDEVSAVGYRLAGAAAYVPATGEEAIMFAAVRAHAALVLVTAEYAARIPAAELRQALAAIRPLTLIVPDVRGRATPPDLGRLVRQQLGMEI